MSGEFGFGICCCDGVGDACPTTGIPQFNVTTYSLQNTLLFFTLTGTTCGDIIAGTYVLDYVSEDANWYYFKRNVTLITRPLNIEVDVSKTMSGGYHTTIAVRVFDATNGFQFTDISGYMYEQRLTGKTFCGCVHSFNVSVFYSSRRWLPDDVPDTLTWSVAGETNAVLTNCTAVNGTKTANLISTGSTVDGFVYIANWNGPDFVAAATLTSSPATSNFLLFVASDERTLVGTIVEPFSTLRYFIDLLAFITMGDADRSIDDPITEADLGFTEMSGDGGPCFNTLCSCTATMTGFSE